MAKTKTACIMAVGVTIILTQILSTGLILRAVDRHRVEAAARVRATADWQKQSKLAAQAKVMTKTVLPDAPPGPPDNSNSADGEDQINKTFSMPAGRVLAMSPEQFVDAYAQKMEYYYKPGSYCGASYGNAMAYYARCLRKRTLRQAQHLPRSRYHKFLRVQRAIEEWLSSYYDWNMLFEINGTFWGYALADDSVAQQQTIAGIASDFRKTSQRDGSRSQETQHLFKLLNSEIENYTVGQVYAHQNDKRFVVLRKRVRKATIILEQVVNSLPAPSRSKALTFIKKVRPQVLDCVSPFEG